MESYQTLSLGRFEKGKTLMMPPTPEELKIIEAIGKVVIGVRLVREDASDTAQDKAYITKHNFAVGLAVDAILDPEENASIITAIRQHVATMQHKIEMATSFRVNDTVSIEKRHHHKWAIKNADNRVLNKHKVWEYEPFPSGRDEAFKARARFDSYEEALDFYNKMPVEPVMRSRPI